MGMAFSLSSFSLNLSAFGWIPSYFGVAPSITSGSSWDLESFSGDSMKLKMLRNADAAPHFSDFELSGSASGTVNWEIGFVPNGGNVTKLFSYSRSHD